MGVKGLATFIQDNDNLTIRNYKLHDSHLIIDALNLQGKLIRTSQLYDRKDLFGGDMVTYRNFILDFLVCLKNCNITPIFVYDGAQTSNSNTSKTKEKARRAHERFKATMSVIQNGTGQFILPFLTTIVTKSILIDKNIKMIQAMYEADLEIARIANEYRCPVLSNDSDFFLTDLPFGVVPLDSLDTDNIIIMPQRNIHYLSCTLYKQNLFTQYFPNLDPKTLPLVGVLAGNDFVEVRKFNDFCRQLPVRYISELYGVKPKQFTKIVFKRHERIIKILYFLCGKTLPQAINQICLKFPRERAAGLKSYINSQLKAYQVPKQDSFESELKTLIGPHYDNSHIFLTDWFKKMSESSVMPTRGFEILHRNLIFLKCPIGDPGLTSPHVCSYRVMSVMCHILSLSPNDSRQCLFFDRHKHDYLKYDLPSIQDLEDYGSIDLMMYDLPGASNYLKKRWLLATFYYTETHFDKWREYFGEWMSPKNATIFLLIKIVLEYINMESSDIKLWHFFKQSTLLCFIYYIGRTDRKLKSESSFNSFFDELKTIIDRNRMLKPPRLGRNRSIKIRLVHQISQLQIGIFSFSCLNALLGDPVSRMDPENWLNCCLIYNLTEMFKSRGTLSKYIRIPNFVGAEVSRQR